MTDESDREHLNDRQFRALARLAKRTDNPVIAQLYTHVLNTPLLIEPMRGNALLGAFLHADTDEIYGSSDAPSVSRVGKVAVIEISGALVSRPMPGPSGDGPQSYEEIRADFDAAIADATVDAILLRLDSCGGFASGCFDLTDHIFASRGSKPIVAVVDDQAFSACYAIAAACDEIWISRTGGVGSVGVIANHADQSGFDKNLGVKWTAVFAGAHKNDFSPHEPLGDAGRNQMQAAVSRLYDIFAPTIARYRGMEEGAVRATEALCYDGAEALAIGFADKLGTLEDALVALNERIDARRGSFGADRAVPIGADTEQVIAGLSGNQPHRSTSMSSTQEKPAITRESIAAEQPAIAEAFKKEGHEVGYKAGVEAGAKQERERIQGVEAQSIPGHEKLIATLKFDGKTTGPEAAVQVLQAEKAARGTALNTMREEAPAPVKPSTETPAKPSKADDTRSLETRAKEAWDNDQKLRADFGEDFDRYFAYEKAVENHQVRVFSPGAAKK